MSDTDITESESTASETSEETVMTPREKAVRYSSLRMRALMDTVSITHAQLGMYDVIGQLRQECTECREAIACNPTDISLMRKLEVAEDALYDVRKKLIQLGIEYDNAEERYSLYQKLSKFWSDVDKI